MIERSCSASRSWTRLGGLMAIALVLTMGPGEIASAAPFTSHLDDLVAELHDRAAALEDATSKADIKRRKGLQKLLKAFAKTSKGPDHDLKLAAKTARISTMPAG